MTRSASRVCDAYCTLGLARDEKQSAADLLLGMDRAGVDAALIAPGSEELAVHNRAGNRRIAAIAASAQGRLIPAFSVNPWRGAEAVDLLREAVDEGGRVLILAPHRQGCHLGDPVADPVVDWAVSHNIPIYAHASPSSSGTPSQMFLLVERFPGGRFLLGRGGTTDYASDMLPLLRLKLPNLWFDTGFVRPSALRAYAEEAPGRMCFASCAPQNAMGLERDLLEESVNPGHLSAILGGNFLQFLGHDR